MPDMQVHEFARELVQGRLASMPPADYTAFKDFKRRYEQARKTQEY